MLWRPVIGHIPGAPGHDSVPEPAGRLPNPGNVMALSGPWLLAMRRIGYGPPPTVDKLKPGSGHCLLIFRRLWLSALSILSARRS